ncbi:hypothetical protein Tco_1554232 [Tanacetum coccineum]
MVMDILIPAPTLLNTFRPVTINNIPYEQLTANLFKSMSSVYSLVPPSKVADKGNGIAQTSNDDILKQVMPFMEEGGLAPNLPNLPNIHHFKAVGEGPMTLEESKIQMQQVKKLAYLKAKKEKSEKSQKGAGT